MNYLMLISPSLDTMSNLLYLPYSAITSFGTPYTRDHSQNRINYVSTIKTRSNRNVCSYLDIGRGRNV